MTSSTADEAARRRWRRCLRLTALLLAIGCAVTFGVSFFARELSFDWFGWPFSFWMAAQGALVVYLVLVVVYARAMRRLDREFGLEEDD
jgi:putative solute:sodium symporter small subunit